MSERDGNPREGKVDFFIHENSMMHKDIDNERMHETLRAVSEHNRKTVLSICISFVLIIIIFVTAYTIRTSVWLDTINRMNDRIVEMALGTPAEVDDAISVHQQSD